MLSSQFCRINIHFSPSIIHKTFTQIQNQSLLNFGSKIRSRVKTVHESDLFKVSVTVRGVGMFMRLFKKAIRCRCIKVHINKFVIHIRILSQE